MTVRLVVGGPLRDGENRVLPAIHVNLLVGRTGVGSNNVHRDRSSNNRHCVIGRGCGNCSVVLPPPAPFTIAPAAKYPLAKTVLGATVKMI